MKRTMQNDRSIIAASIGYLEFGAEFADPRDTKYLTNQDVIKIWDGMIVAKLEDLRACHSQETHDDVMSWVREEGLSFDACCEAAGMDPEIIRNQIIWLERKGRLGKIREDVATGKKAKAKGKKTESAAGDLFGEGAK